MLTPEHPATPTGCGTVRGIAVFAQVVKGKVADRALLDRQIDAWRNDVKPGSIGFLGSTGGITDDGQLIIISRFESAESAAANSRRPEQDAWWTASAPALDGPSFTDCSLVDVFGDEARMDGAGFVQVMEGRAKDQDALRAAGKAMEAEVRDQRPDVIGLVVAWHGDGGFTQVVYFESEEAARAGEAGSGGGGDDWMAQIDGDITFYDLRSPLLD